MRRLTKGCVGYQLIDQIIADYGSLTKQTKLLLPCMTGWGVGLVGDIEVEGRHSSSAPGQEMEASTPEVGHDE